MRLFVLTTICLIGLTASSQPPLPAQPPGLPRPPKGPSKIIIIRDGDTTITMIEPGEMRINGEEFLMGAPDKQLRKLREGRLLYRMPNYEMREENKALLGVATEKDEKGARIVEVNTGTPAEKCGLQKDDIITAINGNSITDPENLYKEVGKYQPADKINIDFLRNGEVKTTTTKLAPNLPVERTMPERIQDLNLPFLRDGELRDLLDRAGGPKPNLGLTLTDTEKARGVQVEAVKENTPAAKAGLQKNDLLLSINGKELKDVDDIRKLKSSIQEGDTWKMVFERSGKKMETDLKFPKKLKTADL